MSESLITALAVFAGVMVLLIGVLSGWLIRTIVDVINYNNQEDAEDRAICAEMNAVVEELVDLNPHPECFDVEGNIILEDYWLMEDLSASYGGEWPPEYDR